jgi:hypothetical protein
MKHYIFPIALVLLMAGGGYVLLRESAPAEPVPHVETAMPAVAAPAPATAASATKSALVASAGAAHPDDPPAWLRSAADPTQSLLEPATSPADKAASAAEEDRMARMQAVMTKFQRLQSDPQPQSREILAAIDELESINGSSVVGGVRLDVLRSNMLVIEKMQALSGELRKLQGPGGAPSPQSLELVQTRMAQMEALRSQLRSDVMQPGTPAMPAMPAMPAVPTTSAAPAKSGAPRP